MLENTCVEHIITDPKITWPTLPDMHICRSIRPLAVDTFTFVPGLVVVTEAQGRAISLTKWPDCLIRCVSLTAEAWVSSKTGKERRSGELSNSLNLSGMFIHFSFVINFTLGSLSTKALCLVDVSDTLVTVEHQLLIHPYETLKAVHIFEYACYWWKLSC